MQEEVKTEPGLTEKEGSGSPLHLDHDYTASYLPGMKIEPGKAWIDEDAPPLVSSYFLI